MRTLVYHANLILKDCIRYGYLIVQDSIIQQISLGEPPCDIVCDRKIDLKGQYLAPGFVELHSHGAGGC